MKRLTRDQLWERKIGFWFLMCLLSFFAVTHGLTLGPAPAALTEVGCGVLGAVVSNVMVNRAVTRRWERRD